MATYPAAAIAGSITAFKPALVCTLRTCADLTILLPQKRDHSMQQIIQTGHRVNEYRLIIRPSEPVRERLALVKSKMKERYELAAEQLGHSHILLAAFKQYDGFEEKLVRRLQNAAAGLVPFKLSLHNVTSEPTHRIALEVPMHFHMQELIKEIRRHQWIMRIPMQQPFVATHPSIILAHTLTPAQYNLMWPRLQQRHFTASFIVDDLLLLRRRRGEKAWQILERLSLQNMPVLASQGVLFQYA
jgi:hypothetical protein